MRIREFIEELEAIHAEHGDVLVTILERNYYEDSTDYVSFSGVVVVEGRCWDYEDTQCSYSKRKHVRLYE